MNCALCQKEPAIKNSHIVPKFVTDWLKETGGRIRNASNPNRRIQDGLKIPLLCLQCENAFSLWEGSFKQQVFDPIHSAAPQLHSHIEYGKWLLKFSVSVCWRVLKSSAIENDLDHLTDIQRIGANKALSIWEEFLSGQIPNPGQFEQHLIVLDGNRLYYGPDISPYLYRYMLRSVDAGVFCNDRWAVVYAKLGHIIICSRLQKEKCECWDRTKIHVNRGVLKPNEFSLPDNLAALINIRANKGLDVSQQLSERQSDVISKAALEDIPKFKGTEVFSAIQRDVYRSGNKAFHK